MFAYNCHWVCDAAKWQKIEISTSHQPQLLKHFQVICNKLLVCSNVKKQRMWLHCHIMMDIIFHRSVASQCFCSLSSLYTVPVDPNRALTPPFLLWVCWTTNLSIHMYIKVKKILFNIYGRKKKASDICRTCKRMLCFFCVCACTI